VVPYNQPIAASDMLRRFLTNESFVDIESPLIRYGDYSVADEYTMSNPSIAMENGQPQTHITVTLASLLAFVAGIVSTIIFLKIWNKKEGRGAYSRIPDAAAEMNGNGSMH
jgi:hypothetical protein